MTQFNFVPHAITHFFGDGSGICIYSNYTGNTIVLRSVLRSLSDLHSFSALPNFNLKDIQQYFGLQADEAERVLEYMVESDIVTKAVGC